MRPWNAPRTPVPPHGRRRPRSIFFPRVGGSAIIRICRKPDGEMDRRMHPTRFKEGLETLGPARLSSPRDLRGKPGERPGALARACEPNRQTPAAPASDACVRGRDRANHRIFSIEPRKPLKTPKTRLDKGRFSTAEQALNDIRTGAERSPNDAERRPNAPLSPRTEGSRARRSGRRPPPAGGARRGTVPAPASVDERRRPHARGDAPGAPVMSQRKLAQDLELAVALALAEQGQRLDSQATPTS